MLALAALLSAAWALSIALHSGDSYVFELLTTGLEFARNGGWHMLLVVLLSAMSATSLLTRVLPAAWGLVGIVVLGAVLAPQLGFERIAVESWRSPLGVASAVVGLVLLEQVFRNTPAHRRWAVKYLCFGLAGIFVYDLFLYARAYLDGGIDPAVWNGRGFVNALMTAAIALSVKRNPVWKFDEYLSREVVFYSAALAGIGLYLIVMAAGGYYIQLYGGDWGDVVRAIFLAAGGLGLAALVFSESVRSRTRIFLNKNFFRYKYDYRAEWLRFIATLAEGDAEHVPPTAIKAIAQIVESPGGRMWLASDNQPWFVPVGAWGECGEELPEIATGEPVMQLMAEKHWIIDLGEIPLRPELYGEIDEIPRCFQSGDWWLLVPLILSNSLYGFIALREPSERFSLNFEDHDLLRTVGRHIATHVQQIETDRRLAQNRQFEAYNRLTAFIMHDISNLIAQQSMVVSNARKHKNNPAFIEDAIKTIDNSVGRMNRLMEQLKGGQVRPVKRRVQVQSVLEAAVGRCQLREPRPVPGEVDPELYVACDPEHLTKIIEHLVRNGQDATKPDGEVVVEAETNSGFAVIEIRDNGEGMSPSFIRDRLFKPFDSTKGAQGMGIGAYQARDYIRQIGGDIDVTSTPGDGTCMRILLPKA